MSIKSIIRYGWCWEKASSFYFVRHEQKKMWL